MKRPAARGFSLLAALLLALGPIHAQAPAPLELRVMTYNLKYASAKPPNSWPERRPIMKKLITDAAPDIFGTQEGLYPQLKDLASDLPAYEWIGLGRDGGSRGEFMAIFYKRDRFEPLTFDHFWLSDTPEVIGSSTWGNSNRRMVTWVMFRDRQSGREFAIWNTHFDHEVEAARVKSAALIAERMKAVPGIPLIVTGDFNCAAENSAAYESLTKAGGLVDAWRRASKRVNDGTGTFNNFEPAVKGGARIDWILLRGKADVRRAEIITYSEDGHYPSDHFPVIADIRFQSQ